MTPLQCDAWLYCDAALLDAVRTQEQHSSQEILLQHTPQTPVALRPSHEEAEGEARKDHRDGHANNLAWKVGRLFCLVELGTCIVWQHADQSPKPRASEAHTTPTGKSPVGIPARIRGPLRRRVAQAAESRLSSNGLPVLRKQGAEHKHTKLKKLCHLMKCRNLIQKPLAS